MRRRATASYARRVRLHTTAALALTLTLAALPVAAQGEPVPAPAEGSVARAPEARTDHVLAISIDGLNPAAIRRLGRDRAPHLYELIDDGVSTLNARTEVERTTTLPNHTGMLTGRRVEARSGGHGVTWDDDRPTTVQKAAGHSVASIFTVVDKAGGSSALFASKEKFSLYQRSWPKAIDRSFVSDDESATVRKVQADLRDHARDFTFLHLARPDRAGHEYGFLSSRYLKAVAQVDAEIGKVLDTAAARPALADLIVIVTSDHGGPQGSRSHSDRTELANYTVPFIVWGDTVDRGDLYQFNPDYRDPVGGRPGYGAARQPVRNGDVANLAAGLLGLGPVPGSEFDADQDLDVAL